MNLQTADDVQERERIDGQAQFQNALLGAQYQASPDAILVVGSDDRILSYNTRFIEMWGIPPEAMATGSAEPVRQAVSQNLSDLDGWVKSTAEIYKDRSIRTRDEIAFKDGRILERFSSPITSSETEYLGRVWFFHDVTEARRAAKAIQQQNEYFRALQDTAMGMLSRLDVNALLEDIVARAGDLLGTENGYVFLKVPDTDEMELRVGVGAYEGFVGRRTKQGVGLAGQVWETNAPVVVDDYRNWQGRLADASRDILRAVAGVPLRSGNQVVGVVGLAYLDETYKFDDAKMQQLERFAQLAAIALDNAQLYETTQQELAERARADTEIRERNRELEVISRVSSFMTMDIDTTAALEELSRELVDVFQARNCGIALLNAEGTELTVVADALREADAEHSVGIVIPVEDNPSSQYVIENRRSLVIPDAQTDPRTAPIHERMRQRQTKCLAIIPLLAGGQVIGTIGIDTKDPNHIFGDQEIRIAEYTANQMANALEKQRLYDQTKTRAQETATINELAGKLSGELEPAKLFGTLQQYLPRLMPTDAYMVWLYDDDYNFVTRPALYDRGIFYADEGAPRKPVGSVARVLGQGKPLIINHTQPQAGEENAPNDGTLGSGEASASMIYAPLRVGERVRGVISVQSYKFNAYTLDHLALLTSVANYVATALENARLFQETQGALYEAQSSLAETQTLYEISGRLNAANDLHQVLEASIGPAVVQGAISATLYRVHTDAAGAPSELESLEVWPRKLERAAMTSEHLPLNDITGEAQWARTPNEPHLIDDIESDPTLSTEAQARFREKHIRSTAILPLKLGDRWVGVLNFNWSEPRTFTQRDSRLFRATMAQTATVLENRRAEEAVRQQNTYLMALHDTTLGLMNRLDLQELLQSILSRAAELVGTQHGYVHLMGQDAAGTPPELEMRVGIGIYEDFVGTRVKPGQGLAGTVWRDGEPIVVDDYRNYPGRLPNVDRDVLRAVVGVPLKSSRGEGARAKAQTVGVLGLASLEDGRTFAPAQMETLNRFAELAAVALDNAQLYMSTQNALQQTQRVAEREKATAEIADKLYAAPDVQTVLRTAAEELRRSTGSKRAVVRLNLATNGDSIKG